VVVKTVNTDISYIRTACVCEADVETTGAALHENKEATAKSTSQDGGMAVNFG